MLEWTGERYLPFVDPSISGAAIHYEHLHRYAFASFYVKNKKVLDLASGEGFGTSILSKYAKCVVGIDIDHDAILHASGTYQADNISFIQGSICKIPVDGKKIFDIVVCFEAIEHVIDHENVIREIGRVIKDDGILIISTPNKKIYSDAAGYHNPYHKKELYYSDFLSLLNEHFTYIYFLGQQVFSGSSIYPLLTDNFSQSGEFFVELNGNRFSFSEYGKDIPPYFIALASNRRLDPEEIRKSYLIDISNTEVAILNTQIEQYNASIQSCKQSLSEKDIQLLETGNTIKSLETELADQNHKITEQKHHITNLETELADQNHKITEQKHHITNLGTELADQNHKITQLEHRLHSLGTEVSGSEMQIAQLRQHARNLEIIVTNRDKHIAQLKKHTRNLEAAVADKKQQIHKVITLNQNLTKENAAIKQSVTYILSTRFNKKIIETLLPPDTRRRKHYHLGLSAFRILVKDGLSHLIMCYHKRNEKNSTYGNIIIPLRPQETKIQEIDNPPAIQRKVSVIIPTKNAGADFQSTLEKIIHQKGIKTIEIVVVDSGSTDHTPDIAKTSGCRIYLIKPEEFNHGLTRNYGAKHATGDLLVFLVQDAIPIGEFWLYNMVKMLERDKKIAAVTCRQVPRSDADLFACFILWYHNKFLKRTDDTIYSCDSDFDQLTPVDKRISAGIEDTCCMIQKKIFDQFRFKNIQYGEDLDIGIRFLKSGYKTAFVHSSGVIHSHNRDSCYFFKRSFTDTLALDFLMSSSHKPDENAVSLKETMEQILGLHFLIHKSSINPQDIPASWSHTIDQCREALQSSDISLEKSIIFPWTGGFEGMDSGNSLESLIQECAKLANIEFYRLNDSLIREYCNLLDLFSEYCMVYRSLETREREVSESFDKLFSLVAGSHLAKYFCKKPRSRLSESEVVMMGKLGEGV